MHSISCAPPASRIGSKRSTARSETASCGSTEQAGAALFRRQYRDGLDLEQCARTRQLRHADRGAGRRRSRVHVLVSNLTERRDIDADIDDVIVDFDQMLEPGADRAERRLQVLKRQLDL